MYKLGFWLHVLIKKTYVTCHKYKKSVSNVPGKLSAGTYPCLGFPYNFPYFSPLLKTSGRIISDAEGLQCFRQADGWP